MEPLNPWVYYPPVLSKEDFVRRYAKGEFGNASPTWLTLDSFRRYVCEAPSADLTDSLFHLRNGSVAGGETFYKQTVCEALNKWEKVTRPEDWYVSKQVPLAVEKSLLVQGEVNLEPDLTFRYTTVPLPMRNALAESSREVYGILAATILRHHLDPASYEWLQVLLERYPDHAIELSAYRLNWGTIPNHNTIFWEVRKY